MNMETTLTTPKTKITDFSDNYKELVGQIVGVCSYSTWRFGTITEVLKTGFKTDIQHLEKDIFKFDGREKGVSYGNRYAKLFTEETKAEHLAAEAAAFDRSENIRAILEVDMRRISAEQAKAIRAILGK